MDGFVVFARAFLTAEDARIDVGDDPPVNGVGMYPTYASERQFLRETGLGAFWNLQCGTPTTSPDRQSHRAAEAAGRAAP